MAKKIDMVMSIIEILYDDGDTSPDERTRTQNKLQLQLQKLPNVFLSNILSGLEEHLVCQVVTSGKGRCKNTRQRKKEYCSEHSLNPGLLTAFTGFPVEEVGDPE